ncbi:MAG TPA: PKD domain-containing protein, partial [Rhizobacter sp.]
SGSNLQYAWNFGDGTGTGFSTSPNASRAYGAPGHYAVVLTVRSGTGGATSSCSATQTIHTQPTASAPRSSSTIAFDAGRNRVWVVNSDNDSVTAINAANNTVLFEQAVGLNPQTLAQAPDGRIWVANAGSGTVSILDPTSGAVVQTLNLGLGSRPFGVVFNPLGTAAFVTLQGSGRVLKLHPGTGAVQATLTAGSSPRGLAISGDSNRLLVTRYISPADRGEVVEINPSAFVVTRTFALATDPGPDTEASGRGVPNFLTSVTIHPDGKRAWVPSKKDNTLRGSFRDGNPLTFESTVRTIVSQLDLETNTEVLSARRDLNDRDLANAVIFSPLGDYAFISTQGTNQIEVMDAYSRQLVTGLVNVGRAPRGLLITPNGRLYVQNFMSRNVAVYDVSGLLNATSNTATKLVDINAVSGEGLRNTTTLVGRRGMGHGRVHWTGNFDEIQDFEHDIRNAFGGTGFLTDAQFNTGTRNQPLGDRKAGLNADLDALAAYVSSLTSVGRSPFRNADGSLTADGVAGQQIFNGSGGCASCHSGTDFTDSASGVLHDVGTIKASSGRRLGATLTGLDTPTLKGLWDTAPYLHDGSAATLMDVITTANPGNRHGSTSALTPTQRAQLVAYLQQIDDGVDPQTSVNITNLSVRDTANAADWSVQASLQNGAVQYGDRTYALTTVPALVAGGRWIRTANDSKSYTGDPTVTFTISRAADVFVAIDDRVGARPWMTGWTNTGQKLVNNEGEPKSFTIFRRNFPAGTVSLGPSTSAGSMYTVIVK